MLIKVRHRARWRRTLAMTCACREVDARGLAGGDFRFWHLRCAPADGAGESPPSSFHDPPPGRCVMLALVTLSVALLRARGSALTRCPSLPPERGSFGFCGLGCALARFLVGSLCGASPALWLLPARVCSLRARFGFLSAASSRLLSRDALAYVAFRLPAHISFRHHAVLPSMVTLSVSISPHVAEEICLPTFSLTYAVPSVIVAAELGIWISGMS